MKSTNKKVNFILDVYNEKCPKCRKGYVFKQDVRVLNLPVMNDVCEKCNYHFEREPGRTTRSINIFNFELWISATRNHL